MELAQDVHFRAGISIMLSHDLCRPRRLRRAGTTQTRLTDARRNDDVSHGAEECAPLRAPPFPWRGLTDRQQIEAEAATFSKADTNERLRELLLVRVKVAARHHAVIAFGEGLSASEFFHAVQKRQLSRRYPVAIGVVRDVLAHRAALWTSHQAALAALSPSEHPKAAGGAEVSAGQWLLSDTSRDMQVRRLSGLNPGEARTMSESLEAVEKQLQVGEGELHGDEGGADEGAIAIE